MSNINLPRVSPAKRPPSLSVPGRKLLIVAALVAVALVGGRAISRRVSADAAGSETSNRR